MLAAKPLPQDLQAFEDRRRQVSQDVWPYDQTPPNFEIGTTGLRHAAGFMNEEFLSRLRGQPGVALYREMWDNSAVIGAVMFMIQAVLRECEWTVEAADESSEAERWKEHAEQSLEDMDHTWQDFISEIMSFLIFGWAWFEIVLKLRKGETDDPTTSSQFEDGTWGIRKLELRSQDSLWQWKMDRGGSLLGMIQLDTWNQAGQGPVLIPRDKSLHFTTRRFKGNPEGYALSLDTPLPTPDGWSTMGDVSVGDKVYGADGKIRYVVAKSAVFKGRPTYEIEFSSGHKIKADANHLWSVLLPQDKTKKAAPRVARTEDLFDLMQKYPQRFWRNPIDCGRSPVLDAATLALPVDPYLLGYWLGDGCRKTSALSVCNKDAAHVRAYIESESSYEQTYDGSAALLVKGGFKAALRAAGVLEDKHIPAPYLRSSTAQRLALLQGLMDTDGHCPKSTAKDAANVFHNTNKNLIDGVAELVRSLGGHPSIKKRQWAGRRGGTINGHEIIATRDVWEVRFWLDLPAFLLPRKRERQSMRGAQRRHAHTIRAIRRIENQDTVCIEVDSPDHLFLVGEEMVPTHNSLLRPVVGTYHYVKRMQELEAIGWSKDLPLALDTPVPTPDGWTTIGELKEGDKVYDETGKIRYVVSKSEVFKNPVVYEIEFVSGHSIKADGKHLWSVSTKQTRWRGSKSRLLTTKEMFDALKAGSRVRYSLGRTPVLDAPSAVLPVDPYLLGYWLGDGTHSNTSIAVAPKDVASLRRNVEACGLFLTDHSSSEWHHCIVPGFLDQLRAAGVLGDKHIPPQYLRASPEQRLALLQGLMDTDGYSDPKHECEFANTNLNLIYGVMELVRTLGGKPRMRICKRPGTLCGAIDGRRIVNTRTLYGVRFGLDLPAHRIPRKLAKHKRVSDRPYGSRSVEHYVKSIRLVDSEPTQCITVDSPSHMFLAGEGMVPTHNCGTPVMEVPPELLLADADPKYKALAAQLRTMLSQFQVDERAYAMIPSSTDKDGKPTGFKLSLLSSGGRRAMETSPAIQRYNVQIMQCFGADFLQVGQSSVGTRNVFEGKANLFLLGLTHYLDIIESTLNRNLVPKVYKLNNVPRKFWPRYRHGKLDKPDLDALGTFLQKLGAAGLLSPNKELEGRVLEIADLPKPTDEDLDVVKDPSQVTPGKGPDAAAGLMSDEQAKVVMDVNAAVAAKKIHPDSAAKLLAQRLGVDEKHASEFLQEVEKEPVPAALAGTPPPPPAHGLPQDGVVPGAAQAPKAKEVEQA